MPLTHPKQSPSTALTTVVKRNPFDYRKEFDLVPIEEGRALLHYVGRYLTPETSVYLDGELILPERLTRIVPQPGQQALVLAKLAGGGDGKTIIRSLAMVALAVVVGVLTYGLGTLGWFGGLISAHMAVAIGGGIMLGGSMLINYATAPRPQNTQASQSYSWSGPVAAIQQGSPIPKIYGKTRVNLAGYPIGSYTTASAHQMTLDALYSLGWGKLANVSLVKINDNEAANYPSASIDWRPGTNTQTPVAYINQIHDQRPEDSRIRAGAAAVEFDGVRTDTQGIIIQLFCPKGLWAGPDSSGRYDPWTVTVAFRYRLHGSIGAWTEQICKLSDNRPTGGLYFEFRFDGLAGAQYDVQLENLGSANYSNQTPAVGNGGDIPVYEDATRRGAEVWLRSIDEIVYRDLAYPNIALLAIRAVATDSLSGNIQVSALCEAEVPDTVAGTQLAGFAADNPAVVCWDAMTNTLYGASIDPVLMDEAAFGEWAAWCDELVPDGAGGYVKRATWNGIAGDVSNVWDFVQSVARISRSVILRTGTRYTVITDKPQPITQIFTVGNIKKDSFHETWLPLQGRANSITVYYYDETNDYVRTTLTVEDLDAIAAGKTIVPSQPIDLQGCVSKAQAWRHATYLLRANKYLLRTCEFEAPADAVACVVGDVIGVQHDVPQWGAGGRIVSAAGTAVKLDRKVTMIVGHTYVISVMLADVLRLSGSIDSIVGTRVNIAAFDGLSEVKRLVSGPKDIQILDFGAGFVDVADASGLTSGDPISLYDVNVLETKNVVNVPGESDSITLASAFSVDPEQFDIYTFGESNAQMKAFRVLGVGRSNKDSEHTIKAIEYRPELFEDLEPVLFPDSGPEASQIAVTDLNVREFPNPTPDLPALAITWRPGPLTEGAYIYAQYGVWHPDIVMSGTPRDPAVSPELPAGAYYARVVVEFPDRIVGSNELGPFGPEGGVLPSGVSLPSGWAVLPAIFVEYVQGATSYKIYIGTTAGAEDHYVDCGVIPTDGALITLDAIGTAGAIPSLPDPVADTPEQFVKRVDRDNSTVVPVKGGSKVTIRVVGFNAVRGAAPHSTAPTQAVVIVGNGELPHNVMSFRCSAFASGVATLEWDAVPESVTDSALLYEIRFAWSGDTSPSWERSVVVVDNLAHDVVTYDSSRGEGTYFIRARNAAGFLSGIASSCYASTGTVLTGGNPDPDPWPVGGGGCPAVEMWLDESTQAGDSIGKVTVLDCIDPKTEKTYHATVKHRLTRRKVRCVRVVPENGNALVVSHYTPYELRGSGITVWAPDMLGRYVATDEGPGTPIEWSRVIAIEDAGLRDVAHIDAGGETFAAGETPTKRQYSHNMSKAAPEIN